MPLLGESPPPRKHAVIIVDGSQFRQGLLLELTDGVLTIETNAPLDNSALRIFPVYPEKDGLYELQGIVLDRNENRFRVNIKTHL